MVINSRRSRVFVAALVSILAGTTVLQSIGGKPPKAGAFSLSEFSYLKPVDQTVLRWKKNFSGQCKGLEIYYSCNINQKAENNSEERFTEEKFCDFIVCNSAAGSNGQIKQFSASQNSIKITPEPAKKVRICVATGGQTDRPSDIQIKRTEILVGCLSREFEIRADAIRYPSDWW